MVIDTEIRDVTDTALWVAAHRAFESQRANAAFYDPLAEVLVGERGHALRRSMPGCDLMHWVMTVRTVAIDRLIQSAVALGTDTVINLGAGLDTRPYRLQSPKSLHWVEIDLPNIIELKEDRLKSYAPSSSLERVALDVTDRAVRNTALADITSRSQSAVILTEGLLPYLDPAAVASLANDLLQLPRIKYWIQDYYNGDVRDWSLHAWRKRLASAPFKFVPQDWFGYFAERGWAPLERIRLIDEARRLGRRPPVDWWEMLLYLLSPPGIRHKKQERAGYVMLRPATQ